MSQLTPEEREILRLWGVIADLQRRVPTRPYLMVEDPPADWREYAKLLAWQRYVDRFFNRIY